MLQPLERMDPSGAWCGRSWEGLVGRRCEAFAHALVLQGATSTDADDIVSDFFELFRDEEEWIFRSVRPTPESIIRALEEHIAISSLIGAIVGEAQTGWVDPQSLHRLGDLLERHLLMEEEEVRPLATQGAPWTPAL